MSSIPALALSEENAYRLETAIMQMVSRVQTAERQFAWSTGKGDEHARWERACVRRDRAVRRLVAALAREVSR